MRRLLIPALFALAAAAPAERTAQLQNAMTMLDQGRTAAAQRLLRPLADEGSAVAEAMLGVIEARGLAGRARPEIAVAHYYRAAERGYAPAQLALARALAAGEGTKASSVRALRWALVVGRHSGEPVRGEAAALARELAAGMAPSAVNRIAREATRWRPWDASL